MMPELLLIAVLQFGAFGQGDCDNGRCYAERLSVSTQSGASRGATFDNSFRGMARGFVVRDRVFSAAPGRSRETFARDRRVFRPFNRLFNRPWRRN
jgi:hypothetical protein